MQAVSGIRWCKTPDTCCSVLCRGLAHILCQQLWRPCLPVCLQKAALAGAWQVLCAYLPELQQHASHHLFLYHALLLCSSVLLLGSMRYVFF